MRLRQAFDTAEGELDFFRLGQLGTRRGNALKLWAALRTLGRSGYQEEIERQLRLTEYAVKRLRGDDFEVLGDVQTAVCCVRYRPRSVRDPDALDALQLALQRRVERSGQAWLATTVVHGRRVLRININGLLTGEADVDALIALLRRESAALQTA
jgi:aromatic-L-amino-acid decarboxylase